MSEPAILHPVTSANDTEEVNFNRLTTLTETLRSVAQEHSGTAVTADFVQYDEFFTVIVLTDYQCQPLANYSVRIENGEVRVSKDYRANSLHHVTTEAMEHC